MKKTTKIALIVLAAVVAGIVLFNLLPDGIRICSNAWPTWNRSSR